MSIKRKLVIAVLIVIGLAALAIWRIEVASTRILATHYPPPANPLAATPDPADAKTGEQLAHLDGCFACHGRDLTGHVMFSGPFGTKLVAPNLTRLAHHRSDAQLAAAIRYGVAPDGTSLVTMPSARYIRISDSDVAAIIAYLHTLAEKPDMTPKLHWGLGGRTMLALGLLPLSAKTVNGNARGPLTTPTEPMALGHYIAMSQCASCHGPDLSGDPEEDSPDLHKAVQHYSEDEFVHFFATGNAQKDHKTKTMTRVIGRALKYLTQDEVHSLYAYLKAAKPAAAN